MHARRTRTSPEGRLNGSDGDRVCLGRQLALDRLLVGVHLGPGGQQQAGQGGEGVAAGSDPARREQAARSDAPSYDVPVTAKNTVPITATPRAAPTCWTVP